MPRPKYCWDSCVFLALLLQDQPETDLATLADVVDLFDRGGAIIVTSVLVHAEVLEAIAADPARLRLEQALRRPNAVVQDISPDLARRAGAIRQSLRTAGVNLKTPDATFVATAIVHRCDALQTYDQKLLNLSGRVELEGLRIEKPQADQTTLRF